MLINRNVVFLILSTTSIYYLLLFHQVFRFWWTLVVSNADVEPRMKVERGQDRHHEEQNEEETWPPGSEGNPSLPIAYLDQFMVGVFAACAGAIKVYFTLSAVCCASCGVTICACYHWGFCDSLCKSRRVSKWLASQIRLQWKVLIVVSGLLQRRELVRIPLHKVRGRRRDWEPQITGDTLIIAILLTL